MLFKPEHVDMIRSGRKTQTRRIWKSGPRAKVGKLHWAKTAYNKDSRFARIEILRVWQEPLGAISDADAWAEGYDNQLDYLNAFLRINKATEENIGEVMRSTVWCVEFRDVTDTDPDAVEWFNGQGAT